MASWQLLLSPRPERRTNVASAPHMAGETGAIRYDFPGRDPVTGRIKIRETHYWAHEKVRRGKSGPPLHIHLRQTENFEVLQGKLGILHNGKELVLTKESDVLVVDPGARHAFFPHPSSGEDLVFNVWVTPETGSEIDAGLDENFLRNFSTYLMDCEREGLAPSLFQLLVFLWHADVVLTPPFWLPLVFLKALHYVLAYLVGELLLGYQPTYVEYARPTGSLEAKKAK